MYESRAKTIFRAIYPAFLLIIIYLAVYIAAILVYDAFFRSRYSDINAFMAVFGDAVSIIALVAGGAICYVIYRKDHVVESDMIRQKPASLVPVVLCGILASHGLSILVSLLGLVVKAGYDQTQAMLTASGVFITLLKTVILAPLAEELAFRGLSFRRLDKSLGFWPAALISSALFGVYHLNLLQGIYAFIFGIILCLVYRRFGNIRAVIIMHAAANLVSVLLQAAGLDYGQVWVYIIVMLATLAASAFLIVRYMIKQDQ